MADASSPHLTFNGHVQYVDSKIPANEEDVHSDDMMPTNQGKDDDNNDIQNGGKLIQDNCKRVELSRVSEESEETSPMLS